MKRQVSSGETGGFFTKNLKFITLFMVIFLELVVFSLASKYFLTLNNITTILRQVAILGVVAVGQSIIFIICGVDISIGANCAMTGCLVAYLMTIAKVPDVAAMLIGLVFGLIVGTVNGVVVTKLRIPALIATMGMQNILRGSAYIISGGIPFYGIPDTYTWIANGYVLKIIPVSVVIMLLIFVLGVIFLEKTYVGRQIYALGGNTEATRLAGVNVQLRSIQCFAISGLLSSLGGIMLMYRINSGQPNAAQEYDMNAITSVALGGMSLSGGEGRLTGVLLGVLIIGIMNNGLVLMNVGDYWQIAIRGVILILALAIDTLTVVRNERVAKGKV